MKKICLYIVIIIGLIFLFPVILTTRFSSMETSKSTENIGSEKYYPPYDYKKYGTINLINTKGEVMMENTKTKNHSSMVG